MHNANMHASTPSSDSLLKQAVLWENAELLADLLSGEAASHINDVDELGRTPLHIAAQTRSPDFALVLLNAGADPNVQNAASIGGETPLHVAARSGRQEVVAALLNAGASTAARSVRRQRPIDVATSDSCWQLLKVHDDCMHERIGRLNTELLKAYRADDVVAIEKLCKSNRFDVSVVVDECTVADDGNIPLVCHAAAADKFPVLKIMLSYGASAHSVRHPRSALHYAVAEGALESVAELLDHQPDLVTSASEDSSRDLPIHTALRRSQNGAVKLLLQHKYPNNMLSKYDAGEFEFELPFNLNALNGQAETPLYIACSTGNFKAVQALLGYHVETFRRKQTQHGSDRLKHASRSASAASPEAAADAAPPERERRCPIIIDLKCGVDGKTALFAAVCIGRADIVQALLERGADPNIAVGGNDNKHADCLGSAMQRDFFDCADLLLNFKAKDQFGTAISIAMRNFDAVEREAAAGEHHKTNIMPSLMKNSRNKLNLLTRVLATHVQRDAEYKINKVAMETLHSKSMLDSLPSSVGLPTTNDNSSTTHSTRTFTYNSMYPSTPLAIDWQNIPSLSNIRISWLIQSAMSLNERLQQPACALYAITRLNISHTPLRELPAFLFELHSLRVLNASHCELVMLPDTLPFLRRNINTYNSPTTPSAASSTTKSGAMRRPASSSPVLLSVLQELNISHNKLEMLPVDLFRLPCLQTLDASGNCISFIPLQIWFAPSLNELNLSHNRLVSLPVAAVTSQKPQILPRPTSKLASFSVARSNTLYSFPSTAISSSFSTTTASSNVDGDSNLPTSDGFSGSGSTSIEQHAVGGVAEAEEDVEHLFRQHTLHHACYWMGNISVVQVLSTAAGAAQPLLVAGDAADAGISKLGGRNGGAKFQISTVPVPTTAGRSAADLLNSSNAAAWASRLQVLNVSHNYITELPPQLACLCPILTTLKISNNRLEDAGLTSIYPFAIKHLDLSHNLLTNMPSDLLAVVAESTNVKPAVMHKRQRGRQLTANKNDSEQFVSSTSVTNTTNAAAPVGIKRSNSSYSYAVAASLSESLLTSNIPVAVTSGHQRMLNQQPRVPSAESNTSSASTVSGGRFECGRGASTMRHVSPRVRLSTGDEAAAGFVGCPHRQHWRLENLRSLDLSFNRIRQLVFMRDADHAQAAKDESWMVKRTTKTLMANGSGPVPGRARDASTTRMSSARGATDRNPSRLDLTLFPALTMLDASNNMISTVPADIAEMTSLSALNVTNNINIRDLPPELGLLHRLWTVNARGCDLDEPLRTMLNNPKMYRTGDVLMYLRSVLEDSQPYRRIKLMLVGESDKGKTTLLRAIHAVAAVVGVQQQQQREAHSARRGQKSSSRIGRIRSRSSAPVHLMNDAVGRVRSSSRSRAHTGLSPVLSSSPNNIPLSTVGIDLGEFTYRPDDDADHVDEVDGNIASKSSTENGGDPCAVTFRTWDFAGQDEYYATHQYFLTRRSIYLCVWNMLDGERGIAALAQWLITVQSRAPNAPVVIVGTHLDVLQKQMKPSALDAYVARMRQRIAEQYIDVVDPDKWGLPRVVAQIELALIPAAVMVTAMTNSSASRRSKDNSATGSGSAIKQLCQVLYEIACKERSTAASGSNMLMLDEKVPKLYLEFEQLIYQLRDEMAESGQHPVLNWEQYEAIVRHELHARFKSSIRDARELLQMSRFMHDNGILLHYESSGTLSTLFFLDPQWLCDMLARVISVKQVNPFVKNGLMKTDDLRHLFKSTKYASVDILTYIIELLNKFEVALTLDASLMLIPSHLPAESDVFPSSSAVELNENSRTPPNSRGRDRILSAAASSVASAAVPRALPTLVPLRPITPNALAAFLGKASERAAAFSDAMKKSANSRPFTPPAPLFRVKYDDARTVRRFYLTKYFPSGFWARLITRLISDERYQSKIADVLVNSNHTPAARRVWRAYLNPHWVCWQNGIELVVFEGIVVMRLRLQGHQPISYDAVATVPPLSTMEKSSASPVMVRNSKPPAIFPTKTNGRKRSETFSTASDAVPIKPVDFDSENAVSLRRNRSRFRKTLALPTNALVRFGSEAHKTFYDGYESKRTLLFANYSVIELTVVHAAVSPCSTTPAPLKALFDDSVAGSTSPPTEPLTTTSSMFGKAEVNVRVATFLLNITAHHIDSLLEDWYPSVGTRFLHTSHGENLLYRVCICPYCYMEPQLEGNNTTSAKPSTPKTDLNNFDADKSNAAAFEIIDFDTVTNEPVVAGESRASSRNSRNDSTTSTRIISLSVMQGFLIEECICCILRAHAFACPLHGELNMSDVAPDVIFADIPAQLLVKPTDVKRGRILGSGAFGFVFKAVVYEKGGSERSDVAVKTLVPCEPPGYGADPRYMSEYRAALNKWQREPLQTSTQAYLSARQELNILTALTYRYIVALRGICLKPFSLVLELAPCGSLLTQLQKLFHTGTHLRAKPLQRICVQIAQALEFLHLHHIIFRDLKSDNVLVWELDDEHVLVKLADYGISRIVAASNTTKGFAGTEAYIAPEIIKFAGEEEYNEKADCYSFAMLMYELITLRQPLSGQEALKEFILDGGRPPLTTSHLHYPSPVYDLMVLAWSQAPSERPSSSQLVSITRTPEFSHLQDAVALNEAKTDTGSAGVFGFSSCFGRESQAGTGGGDGDDFLNTGGSLYGDSMRTGTFSGSSGADAGDANVVSGSVVWLLSRSGVCDMLEIDHEGFREHKSRADCLPARISLAEKVDDNQMWIVSPTTSLLVIDIHSAWTAEKLDTVVLPEFTGQTPSTPVKITAMHFIDALKLLALTTGDNRLVILHTLAHMRTQPERLVVAHCKITMCQPPVTAIASHTVENVTQIWLAGRAGILSVFELAHAQLYQTRSTTFVSRTRQQHSHEELLREISGINVHQLDRNSINAATISTAADDLNELSTTSAQLVKFLTCSIVSGSNNSGRCTIYTYCVFENSTVLYQLDAVTKQLVNKFDYSKIPPVSESFQEDGSSLRNDAENAASTKTNSAKAEVAVDRTISSLCAYGQFVYVGTANGTLIVLDQRQQTLRTVIRPHHRSLFALVPLSFRLPFSVGMRSMTPSVSTESRKRAVSVGRQKSGDFNESAVDNDVANDERSNLSYTERIVGIGHGYRDVISRFLYDATGSGGGVAVQSSSAANSSLNIAGGSTAAVLPANRKKQNVVPHVVCGTLWRHEDWNWS